MGTLRLEYGKSGIYDSNRLPAEKEKKKLKIPGIGRYPMGPTKSGSLYLGGEVEKAFASSLCAGIRTEQNIFNHINQDVFKNFSKF